MRILEAISTCIDVFENDKHPVKGLVDIFSGRVVDEATVNVHTSETVSIETLFSHELAPHPSALFDGSGEMRKTSKSVKTKLQVLCGMRNR